jgi:hypothetical protein
MDGPLLRRKQKTNILSNNKSGRRRQHKDGSQESRETIFAYGVFMLACPCYEWTNRKRHNPAARESAQLWYGPRWAQALLQSVAVEKPSVSPN